MSLIHTAFSCLIFWFHWPFILVSKTVKSIPENKQFSYVIILSVVERSRYKGEICL